MNNLLRVVVSRQARLTTGIAAMGALAIALWPWVPSKPDIPKAIPFVLAFVAWLFSELAGLGEVHPQDAELFNRFKNALTEVERDRLKNHDMANSFPEGSFYGSLSIADGWKGPKYEFIDKALQKHWKKTLGLIVQFSHYLAHNTWSSTFNPRLYTVRTHLAEERGEVGEVGQQSAKELNRLAGEVTTAIEEFDRMAALRLKIHLH